MRKKRILYICHDGALYGSQQSLKLMLENLANRDLECFVSFARPGPLMTYCQSLPHIQVLQHQRLQLAKHNPRSSLQRLGDVLSLLVNLPRLGTLVHAIRANKIDLVHSNSLASLEGALAAKITNKPHFWHIREIFTDYHPRFHLTLGKWLTTMLVHHLSQRVICISKYVQSQFLNAQLFPQQYPVIYNAAVLANHQPQPPQPGPTFRLLYAARISDAKRFQDIVHALCLLKKQFPHHFPIELSVYGEFFPASFETWVHQTIRENALENHIHFYGFLENLDPAFDQKHLLLMPSSSEPFGRTLLDALSRGIPVLAAQSGAAEEIIEDGVTGFFHRPQDPADLASRLLHLYERRDDLLEMRSACHLAIQRRFSIETQCQQLIALYSTILS